MRAGLSSWAMAALLTVACSPTRERTSVVRRSDAGPAPDATVFGDAGALDATSPPADGGSGQDAEASRDGALPFDSGPPPDAGTADSGVTPFCQVACNTPADCATEGSPLVDADNWRCDSGICTYLSCNGTSECTAAYGAGYACAETGPGLGRSCVRTCTTVDQCAVPSPLNDADNYTCTSGLCSWTGCNSDMECREATQSSGWVCEPLTGTSISTCMPTCSVASDCSASNLPAFDADNYACVAQRCRYVGCRGDAECRASFMDGRTYVCR